MKKTFYFSHDYYARHDIKMEALSMEKVGIYWCLVEMLYEENGYIELKLCERIAIALRTQCDIIKSVLQDYELFENDGVKFWSNSVLKRLKLREEKSNNARNSAKIRWNNKIDEKAIGCERIALKESKVKESKVKESKVNKELINSALSNDGVKEIMDIFYKINPTLNWGNKTIRKACESLIKKYGLEGAKKIAQYAISIQGEKYAPTVTSPYQLWNKLAELKIYHDRQNNNKIQSL
jgi:hypothetical protein